MLVTTLNDSRCRIFRFNKVETLFLKKFKGGRSFLHIINQVINHVAQYAAQPTSTCSSRDMYEHLAMTASVMTEQSFFTFPFFKFPKPIRKCEKYLIPFFFSWMMSEDKRLPFAG